MARKKKSRKKSRRPRLSQAQLVQPTPVAQTATVTNQQAAGDTLPDLRDEYRYVVADLRRIAIIAAAMMVVMIVLALLAI
ncbi:MAG TPA: hypothetical protein ENK08_10310 [Chloroflexi bacterium]|nr:hypothetical protein [Chloroflexota bacterium]